jgi:hypothetical protein
MFRGHEKVYGGPEAYIYIRNPHMAIYSYTEAYII